MKRGKPLNRGKPLARKPFKQKPRKPLPAESARTKAQRREREKVREDALHRAGYRCSMVDKVPEVKCWGPLDVDEIKSRGVNPGGHLDASNVQVACRAHHEWRTANPKLASERGLRLKSWE